MTLGMWTLIGLFAAAAALRFAMRATLVDAEHLYAALSAYLLAGIFFGLFYWVLQQIWPGTFAVTGDFSRMSAIYFSFVTIATLGYGDIVPRSDVARGLAIVEGVGGQLFLAVMVARLVSLYCARDNIRLIYVGAEEDEPCAATAGTGIRLKQGGLCGLEVDGVPPKERAVLQSALDAQTITFYGALNRSRYWGSSRSEKNRGTGE